MNLLVAEIGAIVLLCLHPVLNAAFPGVSDAITDVYYSFWLLLAIAATGLESDRTGGMRRNWILFSMGLSVWFLGTLSSAWAEFVQHAAPRAATVADFLYFFYGVPILLAIAAPDDGQGASLFWLDGLQAAGLGLLAYVALFDVLPFSGAPVHPIPVERMVWIYDAENALLAILAAARLAGSPPQTSERRFLRILTAYLWIYMLLAGAYNHIFTAYSTGWFLDFVDDLPFVLLIFAALLVPPVPDQARRQRDRHRFGIIADNARPILLGLSLVLLSTWIARAHFEVAVAMILGAFFVYGIRSTMLQTRLVRSQLALEAARDRLEELAHHDALTRIPNRRSFDERFIREWHRARRTRLPLSLLLIDVDRFKRLNDTYGHRVGDDCLVQIAQTLQSVVNRPGDLLARYGGEEFVALLPETDSMGARNVGARMQAALAQRSLLPTLALQVTISIGATTWENSEPSGPELMLETADRALYLAKDLGRNRLEFLHLAPHSLI